MDGSLNGFHYLPGLAVLNPVEGVQRAVKTKKLVIGIGGFWDTIGLEEEP